MKNYVMFVGAHRSHATRALTGSDISGFSSTQTIKINGSNDGNDAVRVSVSGSTINGNFGGNTKRAALNTNGGEMFAIVKAAGDGSNKKGDNVTRLDTDTTSDTYNTFIAESGNNIVAGGIYKYPVAGISVSADGNTITLAKGDNSSATNGVTFAEGDIVTVGLAGEAITYDADSNSPSFASGGTTDGQTFAMSKEFCAIYPEDSFITVKPISDTTSSIIFKNEGAVNSADLINVVHGSGKWKEVAALMESALNAGKKYAGPIKVIDTSMGDAVCFGGKNDAVITDISFTLAN